jgi:hypothetical protein
LESEAKVKFRDLYMKENHVNFMIEECGLMLDGEQSYLGASPDLLISCSCCGAGVVEIKCPLTSFKQSPTPHTVLFLTEDKSRKTVVLNRRDKYYTQIQGQMGITNRNYCEFFVYCGGDLFHRERIELDMSYWSDVYSNLQFFFKSIFLPVLLTSNE